MIWPPGLIHVQVAGKEHRRIRLWLPIFLLWPLLFVAILIAPTAALLIPQLRRLVRPSQAWLAGAGLLKVFCALRGLQVRVDSRAENVRVSIW